MKNYRSPHCISNDPITNRLEKIEPMRETQFGPLTYFAWCIAEVARMTAKGRNVKVVEDGEFCYIANK